MNCVICKVPGANPHLSQLLASHTHQLHVFLGASGLLTTSALGRRLLRVQLMTRGGGDVLLAEMPVVPVRLTSGNKLLRKISLGTKSIALIA